MQFDLFYLICLKKAVYTGSQSATFYSCLASVASTTCGSTITLNGTKTSIYCCNTNNCNAAQFLKLNKLLLVLLSILFETIYIMK